VNQRRTLYSRHEGWASADELDPIPRSSGFSSSCHKRRKTDDLFPPVQSQSHELLASPKDHHSLPSFSPHSQFSSQRIPPTLGTHRSVPSGDHTEVVGAAKLPDDPLADFDATFGRTASANPTSGAPFSPTDLSLEHPPPTHLGQEGAWLKADPQEACLMRYFVEKLAHWVSGNLAQPLYLHSLIGSCSPSFSLLNY
jgi:hypothetical protein